MKGLDLPARLRVLTVASCSCMTKTHNPAMHAESCLFRTLCEAADELERLAEERTITGIRDANGDMIRIGDRVVYRNQGVHTKPEYWNPEFEVVWASPGFTLQHVGGGLPGDSLAFKFIHGGGNGVLFIIGRAADRLKSPDAGALASQQKEEPPMAQRFGYTGPHEQGDTYVKFAQLFDAPNGGEGFDLTVRDGDGKSTTLRLPPDEAHKMAMALMPAPVPTGATPTDWAEAKAAESILQFFTFDHLPPHLQDVSGPFAYRALSIVQTLPRNPERTVALRKLLEAKDAAVRALLFK